MLTEKVTILKWRKKNFYMAVLCVKRKTSQRRTWTVSTKCEIGSVNAIYFTRWTASETVPMSFFLLFFASNRLFQEPTHKEDNVILNKIKQTGKVYIWRTQIKNSPNTKHTKHSSHLIFCYMLWGSQERKTPRKQNLEVMAQATSMWQIHAYTHTPTHTTDSGRSTHACTGGQRTTGEMQEREEGWSRISLHWKLGTQRMFPLWAEQKSKSNKGWMPDKSKMLREDWRDEEGKMQGEFWENSLRRGFSLLGTWMGREGLWLQR